MERIVANSDAVGRKRRLMNELRECPFCGKTVSELTTAKELEDCAHFEDLEKCPCHNPIDEKCKLYTVVCNYMRGGCGAISGYFTDPDKAILRWNTRGESWR